MLHLEINIKRRHIYALVAAVALIVTIVPAASWASHTFTDVPPAFLTISGDQVGSVLYVSPRQREAPHEAGFEDDAYSACCCIWEGRAPCLKIRSRGSRRRASSSPCPGCCDPTRR